MQRAIHVLSDEKFIDKHIARFERSYLDNRYIYLNRTNKYQGIYSNHVEFINEDDDNSIQRLSKSVENYDLIFVYFLNYGKVKFINHLKGKKPVIIWFFFGAELYSTSAVRSKALSAQTKRVLKFNWLSHSYLLVKSSLRVVKYGLKGVHTPQRALETAIEKIDYFAWYSREEYDYIQRLSKIKLPPFLHLNIKLKALINEPLIKDEISILLGNSRDPLNNHIDIINILKSVNNQVKVDMPFSYGANNAYANSIRSIVSESRLAIKLHEEFMSYNEYVAFVGQHSTAIYNSYRQMALGNILVALWSGLKVYLSIKNPTYLWLNNLGFRIFSIEEDLICDLKSNNLVLERESIEYNFKLYADISKEENDVAFMKKLYGLTTPS